MSEPFRIVRGDDGIVTATFDRPAARNALTFEMYDGLAELCAAIDADISTRALILTGAGTEAFAAGTDIAQFEAFSGDADALAYEARIERVLSALERCRVPTIAAIAALARVVAPPSPAAAIFESVPTICASASRSPVRSAIASRRRMSRGSSRSSAKRA